MRRVIVCGGRDWPSEAKVHAVLDEEHKRGPITTLVHGACPTGADLFADSWAVARKVPVERHPADWNGEGRAAGPMRNARMAKLGAHLCIAFAGGRGTADMTQRARAKGILVREVPA